MPLDFEKVRALRLELELSQEEAASRSGVGSRQNWNAIERGRAANITLDTLDRIATVLKTTPADLLKK